MNYELAEQLEKLNQTHRSLQLLEIWRVVQIKHNYFNNFRNLFKTRKLIADYLVRLGRAEEAINLYREIYSKQKINYGPYHLETIQTACSISIVTKSVECFNIAFTTKKKKFIC